MSLVELQASPEAFRNALLIDTDSGPRPLAEVLDPWQGEDFHKLDAGWIRAVKGKASEAEYQRAWLERSRGHSKSADLAVMCSWALFASQRPLSGIAAAGDQDQARLLRDAVGRLTYLNPWLGQILEVQNNRIVNIHTGSTLEIITSDAKTSYGLTPDFVICDEVTHWAKRDLWDSLLSSAAKRSTCMFVVITNAGVTDEWQWETREAVRADPKWYFSRLDGPVASWLSPDLLDEQRRLLPPIAYRRLWLNEWTSGGGDALSEELIKAAFNPALSPQEHWTPGYEYVGGLDLGVSRDSSCVVILGVRRGNTDHGRIRLAFTKIWRPEKGKKINLQQVESMLISLHLKFNLKVLNYDPWEARHMAQRLSAHGIGNASKELHSFNGCTSIPMMEVTPSGQNLQRIATVLIEAFNDRRLDLFEDPDLRRDLSRLRVEERQYGFRLVSPRDGTGHGDMASAFSLAMLAASELAGTKQVEIGTIGYSYADPDKSPLEKAYKEFQRRAYLRQQEIEALAAGGYSPTDSEGWKETLRYLRRT